MTQKRRFSRRFSLRLLCSLCWSSESALPGKPDSYRRQVLVAKTISDAGGRVEYGWRKLQEFQVEVPTAHVKQLEINGDLKYVPHTVKHKVIRVRHAPPYTVVRDGQQILVNDPKLEPKGWRPFDFEHNWDIVTYACRWRASTGE